MTRVVNVQEAKTHLSRLLARVESGEDIVISRAGVPIATLSAVSPKTRRELGFVSMSVPDDFDEPLPDDELAAWSQA